MGCYLVPATAALIHFFMRKRIPSFRGKYNIWLNQLLLGGAVFGVVDHWWNKELFLFGENFLLDIALGLTITLAIFIVWGFLVLFDKLAHKHTITVRS